MAVTYLSKISSAPTPKPRDLQLSGALMINTFLTLVLIVMQFYNSNRANCPTMTETSDANLNRTWHTMQLAVECFIFCSKYALVGVVTLFIVCKIYFFPFVIAMVQPIAYYKTDHIVPVNKRYTKRQLEAVLASTSTYPKFAVLHVAENMHAILP